MKNDFEGKLRRWMDDQATVSPAEVSRMEAFARGLPPRRRKWQAWTTAGAVLAGAVTAIALIWLLAPLRPAPAGQTSAVPVASGFAPTPSLVSTVPSIAPTDEPHFADDQDLAPTWSPDGEWIAFERLHQGQRSVYVVRPDGSDLHRLTDGGNPGWSPDGQWIAFDNQPDGEHVAIFRVQADGTGLLRLTDGAADEGNPAWSPDGGSIAFQSERACCADGRGTHGIWLMDADGSGLRRLTDGAGGADTDPAWSPDGSRIAFTSTRGIAQDSGNVPSLTPTSIWTIRVDGSGLMSVTPPNDQASSPSWSPDGSAIAYATVGYEPALMIVDLATGTARNVASGLDHPDWSRGGQLLAYDYPATSGATDQVLPGGIGWTNVLANETAQLFGSVTPAEKMAPPKDGWHAPSGVQPQSGDGWTLLADPTSGPPGSVIVAVNAAQLRDLATLLGMRSPPEVNLDRTIVVAFDYVTSGSCPEIRFDGVSIDRSTQQLLGAASVGQEQITGVALPSGVGCTSDARPHAFVVAVDRALLPPLPFTVALGGGDCAPCSAQVTVRSDH